MPDQRTKKNDVNENRDREGKFAPNYYRESGDAIHQRHKSVNDPKGEFKRQQDQRDYIQDM